LIVITLPKKHDFLPLWGGDLAVRRTCDRPHVYVYATNTCGSMQFAHSDLNAAVTDLGLLNGTRCSVCVCVVVWGGD
jgi:hypothetical protein